jgi:hypothetical protein
MNDKQQTVRRALLRGLEAWYENEGQGADLTTQEYVETLFGMMVEALLMDGAQRQLREPDPDSGA